MKTAEEWLKENGYDDFMIWTVDNIAKMVTRLQAEHDAEIVKIIGNKIKELKPNKPPDNSTEFFEWRAKIGILTELKKILASNGERLSLH